MGREMLSVTFFRSHVNGLLGPYTVDLARLPAHGWDPLIPTDPGVYDGLQEEPRSFFLAGLNIRGEPAMHELGGQAGWWRSTVNGLDKKPGPTPKRVWTEKYVWLCNKVLISYG